MSPLDQAKQAERMAETRARLLDALVASLAETGYAGTSTTEVARRSGLTRGAQLHHFGTKDRMMVEAVEHLNRSNIAPDIVRALDQMPPGADRFRVVGEMLAELIAGEGPVAYVELWLASHTHPELLEALRASDEISRAAVRSLFGAEILRRAGQRFDEELDVILYALRGMTIDARVITDDELRARKQLIIQMTRALEKALES